VQNNILPYVGKTEDIGGRTLLFCNGIMNDFDSARNGALLISNAFGGRKVFIFHNPTMLNNYFDRSFEEIVDQVDLGTELSKKIHTFITNHREEGIAESQICITLFAHSHGAFVTHMALIALNQANKDKLKVYTFGGAIVIPNRLAGIVHNYIFDEDLISDFGNLRAGEILYQVKQITKFMREKGITLEIAIVKQAYQDLFMELNPLSRVGRSENDKIKDERYSQIFEQRNQQALIDDTYFRDKISEYVKCFTDYSITILEGAPFRHPEYNQILKHSNLGEFVGNLTKNLSSMFENTYKGLAAFSSHVLNNHKLQAYQNTIQRIAQGEE